MFISSQRYVLSERSDVILSAAGDLAGSNASPSASFSRLRLFALKERLKSAKAVYCIVPWKLTVRCEG